MKNHQPPTNLDLAARLDEFENLPILYEDEPECDMGESNWHAVLEHILRYGLVAHMATHALREPGPVRVFSNMNLYYHPRFVRQYVSPDVMVVTPTVPRPDDLRSYRIGSDGPAPLLTAEVLSEETAVEGDLDSKTYIYAMVGIPEYILVDNSGEWLPQRLLLKRLQPDRTWRDEQDPDRGVTSRLGFRLIWANDGSLRVTNTQTGEPYARPDEAQAEAKAHRLAEERIRALEAELARLRKQSKKEPPKRRKKS